MQKILVISNSVSCSPLLIDFLRLNGFQVSEIDDRQPIMDLISRESPRLVLFDLPLDKTSGFAQCQAIRASSNIPIILISLSASQKERHQGFHCGADDFVCKPFSLSELLLRIKSVLKRSANRD
ncbi:response regulator [Shewanella alkalitolerans]|uniref:response regulator transcription factor n=1 Tax=Shewanella alkalitolerans TaxID=2864209 RepID=UPI001C661E9F|nr:response regulator [Shewanella alkalitolerans]QYJ97007.1 response regulator [Shewanella alkalitolerans]